MLRAHQARCAALIGGYARTAEAHALVRSGWAHDVVAPRPEVRARSPRVVALDDSGYDDARDPAARTARLPSIALRAARSALQSGAPVLVQVPRRGTSLAGLRALPGDRSLPVVHGSAIAARRRLARCGMSLVWTGGPDTAMRALWVGRGACRGGGGPAHCRNSAGHSQVRR